MLRRILAVSFCILFAAQLTAQDDIYIIFRSDDIGMAHSINEACIDVYQNGISKSVELMVPTPWFLEAVKMLKQNPGFDVGIHLCMTSEWENLKWRPVSNVPSLVDSNGYFYPTYWPSENRPNLKTFLQADWKIEEVEQELEAQIQLALKHIPRISHMNIHMGGNSADPKIQQVFDKLAKKYNLDVDLSKNGFDYFRGFGEGGGQLEPAEKAKRLAENLRTLKPGKYIMIDHPAFDRPEMQAIFHKGYEWVAKDRQGVHDAYTSDEVKKVIQERGIKLISYKDVKEDRIK